MMTNISSVEQTAVLLQTIGQPARLRILLVIGKGEPCVCHLEATFGWRQAYLSQHLMALRKAGIVATSRKGRNIHYRLIRPELLELIHHATDIQGGRLPSLTCSLKCKCPNCTRKGSKA
jgi:ArsR family transcriptional regulator